MKLVHKPYSTKGLHSANSVASLIDSTFSKLAQKNPRCVPDALLHWIRLPGRDPWTGAGCRNPEPEVGLQRSSVTAWGLKKAMKLKN